MPVPVVYIDVVWLVNFVMDAAILWTTCWIMKRRVRPMRLLLAALIGSGYALLMFFPPLSLFTTWAGKGLVSLWMVGIGIPWRSWLDLGRTVAMFYFITFVFAGAAIAVHFAVPGVSVASGMEVAGRHIAFMTSVRSLGLILGVVLAIALLRFSVQRVRRMHLRSHQLHGVRARIDGREVKFIGLDDSGNQLRDPVSRRPICLLDLSILTQVLPSDLSAALGGGQDMLTALSSIQESRWMRRISIVPYRGAGGTQQLTFAVRPDLVEVEVDGVWGQAATAVLLAAHPGKLSLDNQFQAILHIEAIARDDSIETNDTTRRETQNSAATALGQSPTETGGRQ